MKTYTECWLLLVSEQTDADRIAVQVAQWRKGKQRQEITWDGI